MDMVILYCLSILNKFNNTLVSDLCLWLWSGSLEWEDQPWLGRAAPSDHVRFEALCGFRAQQPFQNGTVCDLAQKSAAAGWQNIPC